ncbi:hypothetical protein J437_LFUL013496 [Ladona fulva]|uniref:Evolutionarily conserved signaling intermediate in Toll pathway, mitochondrial n=1 Tax=Ladona fulva TaxID=123851 RepID=A0A8K0P9G7_LADFU|nr:hypothetical protein J437_LFUL013496 [Ladona fulva]
MLGPKVFNHSICLSCLISRAPVPLPFRYVKSCLRITGGTELSRAFTVSKIYASKNNVDQKDIVPKEYFDKVGNKNKQNYLDMVRIFEGRGAHRRGHVEFIYSALRHMEEFGVHKDLEAYKRLIDVFPKGKFIPTNIFQAEFMHYPKQQQCAIDLLEQMEENGVIPDAETEDILLNIFGKSGHPLRKYWRMMYWMPKFKNLNPWPLPNPVPNDSLELAKLALQQMSSVDLQSSVTEYKTSDVKDSVDDTWVVSVQSPTQMELLEAHPEETPIFVEGAFRVWLRNTSVNYFILRADPTPLSNYDNIASDPDDVGELKTPFEEPVNSAVRLAPSVHEQEEGTVLAMCATGTSSRDSLLSWIRLLQEANPRLSVIPVLFSLRSPFGQVIPIHHPEENQQSSAKVSDK